MHSRQDRKRVSPANQGPRNNCRDAQSPRLVSCESASNWLDHVPQLSPPARWHRYRQSNPSARRQRSSRRYRRPTPPAEESESPLVPPLPQARLWQLHKPRTGQAQRIGAHQSSRFATCHATPSSPRLRSRGTPRTAQPSPSSWSTGRHRRQGHHQRPPVPTAAMPTSLQSSTEKSPLNGFLPPRYLAMSTRVISIPPDARAAKAAASASPWTDPKRS